MIKEIQSSSQMEKEDNLQGKPVFIKQFPFRFVQPYNHTYKTYAKGRWIGKELLLTLIKQFKAYPAEYYRNAIKEGMIKVNDKEVSADYIIKNGDEIIHVSIRVQPPVLDLPIKIVDETDDFLIVCKPPSLIVHTGGGHHYNTVENILKYEHHYNNLHILHRLDKLTSGLLILAKDKQKVKLFHQQSENEIMKKMYYARVGGKFKWQEKQLSAYIECISHKDGIYKVSNEIYPEVLKIKVNQDKKDIQINYKQEENAENNKQQKDNNKKLDIYLKESKTIFKKVWYDQKTDSSLLQCYPVTGRTHQIRVHLQYLGFPILNDVVYGGKFIGNKIIQFITISNYYKEQQQQERVEENKVKPKKKIKFIEQLRPQQWDYKTRPWEIMLHSFKYKFGGQQFKTQLPYWFYPQNLGYKEANTFK